MSPQPLKTLVEGPVHFVGIGGTGMSGLAELALRLDLPVQGSDLKTSPMSERLKSLGAKISTEHSAAILGNAKTLVYSSAIASDNVELVKARENKLSLLHRSDFLGMLMRDKKAVTVAGTHGKTTTSAMITHVLDALGLDPMAAIGGSMRKFGSTARFGRGEHFVAEADESDGSFLKYGPFIGVVTNIDLDHMEYFKDRTRLAEAFQAYLSNIDEEGSAVIGWDNALARQVGSEYTRTRLTYGFVIGSDVRAIDYRCEKGETTLIAMVERDRVPLKLKTMGKHNAQNALCALAVTRALGLDVHAAGESLAEFPGVERRMAQIFEGDGVRIFDDYAHNPGKIAACIEALKGSWPDVPLHVIYQAHRYSRLETMYEDMLGALHGADFVHVVPVYSAGETTSQDFSTERLAGDLKRRFHVEAFACPDLAGAALSVRAKVTRPAVILTVGAGDVWTVADSLKRSYAG